MKGKGYVKDGTIINEPMDFSEKNLAKMNNLTLNKKIIYF